MLNLPDSYAALAAAILNATDSLDFRGIHCHISSQIFLRLRASSKRLLPPWSS